MSCDAYAEKLYDLYLKLDLRPCVHKPPLSLLVVIAGVGFLMWLADVAITLQEKNDV